MGALDDLGGNDGDQRKNHKKEEYLLPLLQKKESKGYRQRDKEAIAAKQHRKKRRSKDPKRRPPPRLPFRAPKKEPYKEEQPQREKAIPHCRDTIISHHRKKEKVPVQPPSGKIMHSSLHPEGKGGKPIGDPKKLQQRKKEDDRLPAPQHLLSPARTIAVYHRIQPGKLHACIERILHHEDRVIHSRRRIKREKEGQLPKRHQKECRKIPCPICCRSPRTRKAGKPIDQFGQ